MATPNSWWHEEGPFEEIASRLDEVRAIDVHTHLLTPGSFRPELDPGMPLMLRSTNPLEAAICELRREHTSLECPKQPAASPMVVCNSTLWVEAPAQASRMPPSMTG